MVPAPTPSTTGKLMVWYGVAPLDTLIGTDSATFENQKVVQIDFVVYCSVKRNYFGGNSEN